MIDYEHLYHVVTRYGKEKWGGLKTPIEDIIQETLIKIFEKSDELKDYDRQHLEGHACLTFRYMALNTLLEEHKKGLWIQNSDLLDNGRSIYELTNDNVSFLNDPWLDEFYKSKRKREKEYYQKMKTERAAYYQELKEKRNAYNKKYFCEHREELSKYKREYSKQYYQKNKEYFRNKNREYRQKKKDHYDKYMREYRQKNKDTIRERNKELQEKAHKIQNEVCEEYGIKIGILDCRKLVTAQKKSEETYKERLMQILNASRSF